MKRAVLRLFYIASYHSGLIAFFYLLNWRRSVVLTYHNILPDALFDNTLHLGVSHSASVFARQIEIINARWPISNNQPDQCLITFDDGYRNHQEIAAGILEQYNRRGVFFVTLCLSKNGSALWPDQILMWLSYVPNGTYQLLGRSFKIVDFASRERCWSTIWDSIWSDYSLRSNTLRDMNAAYHFEDLTVDEDMKRLRFVGMAADDIQDLVRRGHRVGCHSFSHDILSRISNRELEDEFSRCDAEIGRLYNCDLFSYPFGGSTEVTEREWRACEKSRFGRAFMNVDEVKGTGNDNPYAIARMSLPNTDDRYVIEAKLSGLEKFLKTLVSS